MFYAFHTKLQTVDDVNFSYKLMKHPDNVFDRKFSNLNVIGKFSTNEGIVDVNSYEIMLTNAAKDIPQQNKMSWNFVELSALSLRELNVIFNNVLRSAIRGQIDSSLTEETFNTQNLYSIELTPVDPGAFLNYEKFQKYLQIANELNVTLEYNENHTCKIVTVVPMQLHTFLQKAYLLVFSMLAKYSVLSDLTKEKVDQLVALSNDWINEIVTKDLQDYFIRNLLQYKLGLIDHFNDDSVTEVEENVKLHELKHNLIVEYLNSKLLKTKISIVDFGCSTGQLSKKLALAFDNNANYTGVDTDFKALEKAKRKVRKFNTYNFVQKDFLYQTVDNAELTDVLLLVEVIEHLTDSERERLTNIVNFYYKPEYVVITTPNVDYNVNYGMEPGQFRHKDHVIEFNAQEFNDYISNFINYKVVHTFKLTDGEIDPSFAVVLNRQYEVQNDAFVEQFKQEEIDKIKSIGAFESQFLMPEFDYIVSSKEIRIGSEGKSFNLNKDHVFYLGATMAPADIKAEYNREYTRFETDFNDQFMEIESPEYAIKYFANKEVDTNDLVAEIKYMGSRGYILAFKDKESAARFNMPLITINSRNGYTFFDEENQDVLDKVYNVVKESFLNHRGNDFIMLDCEITPWSFKAKNLIYYDFELPVKLQLAGLSTVLNSETFDIYTETVVDYLMGVAYCTEFLETLKHFSTNEQPKVYIFDVLASGNINGKHVNVVTFRNTKRADVNAWLNKHLIKNNTVEIAKQVQGVDAIYQLWDSLDDSYEGIVIKPNEYTVKGGSGIIPYMKCRRNSYLQLIYGPYFNAGTQYPIIEKVYWRNIAKKRRLSAFQSELSHLILKAFFKQDQMLLHKYIAAFYATDGLGNFGGIDLTL